MTTKPTLDESFGVIPPDVAARIDGRDDLEFFDYFREPSIDELIAHHLGYIEAWGEEEQALADVKWWIHMSLVTVRILAKLRDQQTATE